MAEREGQRGKGPGRSKARSKQEMGSPEERTAAFFAQEVGALTDALAGKLIGVVGTDTVIRLDLIEGYGRDEVGRNYRNGIRGVKIDSLSPGDVWAFPIPRARMRQTLIAAKDQGQTGACIRFNRASVLKDGNFVPMPREGDISNALGLTEDNEVAVLRYLDDSDTLYVDNPRLRATGKRTLDSAAANEYIGRVIGEEI